MICRNKLRLLIFIIQISLLISTINTRRVDRSIRSISKAVKEVTDAQNDESPTKIEIFYETANVNVRNFFLEQLRPFIITSYNEKLSIFLYPFGRTTNEGNDTNPIYKCHFGEEQCLANKYHACLIDIENNSNKSSSVQNSTLDFTICFFKNRFQKKDVTELFESCLESDVMESIEQCLKSDDITKFFEEKTQILKGDELKNGLAIKINDNLIENDKFTDEICKNLKIDSDNEICKNGNLKKLRLNVYYEAMNYVMSNYVKQQLKPYFIVLEDIIDIYFIPFGTMESDDQFNLNCTLGQQQCFSNQYQALVANKYVQYQTTDDNISNGQMVTGPNMFLNFLSCLNDQQKFYDINNEYSRLEICSEQNLEPDEFRNFKMEIKSNTDKLKAILGDFKNKTQAILSQINSKSIDFPFVSIVNPSDGQEVVNPNALDDLVQAVCNKTEKTKPKICEKIPLMVMYEAEQHQSRTFYFETIKPIFENLYNLIDFKFVPAGNCKMDNNKFVCPGGDEQIKMSKIQSCAINMFYNDGSNFIDHQRQNVFDFMFCLFKNTHLYDDNFQLGEYCSNLYFLDSWIELDQCVKHDGDSLFQANIEDTLSVTSLLNVTELNIPMVVVYGQDKPMVVSNDQLKEEICNMYDSYHQPNFCFEDKVSKIELNVYYDSNDGFARHFFLTQLSPWYRMIEEIVDINLNPIANTENLINDDGCVNGSNICLTNMLHSYVIDQYDNHDNYDIIDGKLRAILFLSCFYSNSKFDSDFEEASKECSQKYLIHSETNKLLQSIKLQDDEPKSSLKLALSKTKELKTKLNKTTIQVPWITVDDDQSNHRAVIDDLVKSVCSKYQGSKPLECTAVTLDIYYSPLDGKTRKFFIENLIPIFGLLRERINVNLYPYGFVQLQADNSTSDAKSECDERPSLCQANKIHACVLKQYYEKDIDEIKDDKDLYYWDTKNQTMMFLYCFYKNIDHKDGLAGAMLECSNRYFLESDDMNACYKSEDVFDYMNKMRQKTIDAPSQMNESPFIFINGYQSSPVTNLQTEICSKLLGELPDVCDNEIPSKVKMDLHYSPVSDSVSNYIKENLVNSYRDIEEIIDLNLIPFGLASREKTKLDDANNNTNQFPYKCPGEDQCLTTREHVCINEKFSDQSQELSSDLSGTFEIIDFLNCFYNSKDYPNNPELASEECVNQTFGADSWNSVFECSQNISHMIEKFEINEELVADLTDELKYIPYVTINDAHSTEAEKNFTSTVCNDFKGDILPDACVPLIKPPTDDTKPTTPSDDTKPTTPSDDTKPTPKPDDKPNEDGHGFPAWAIVLIVIAVIIVLAGVTFFLKRKGMICN